MELLDPFGIQHQSCPLSKWAESHAVQSNVAFGDWTWSSTTCNEYSLLFFLFLTKKGLCGTYDNMQSIMLTCIIVTFKSYLYLRYLCFGQ